MNRADNPTSSPLERRDKVRRHIIEAVKSNKRVTFATLLEQTGLARSTLAKHLKELNRGEQLLKEESKEDARVVYYSLTKSGENLYLKEHVISCIEDTYAGEGTVNEHEIKSIPLPPVLNSLLDEDEKDGSFPLIRTLLSRTFYEGLQKSTSATVISERTFVPDSIRLSGVGEACSSILGSLIENKMSHYSELEEQLREPFLKKLNEIFQTTQEIITKGQSQEAAVNQRTLERLTNEAFRMEKDRMEWIRKVFKFSFAIVIRYDGEQLSRAIDEYLKNTDVICSEHRLWIEARLRQASAKSLS